MRIITTSDDGFVDNAKDVKSWRIDTRKTVGILIKVHYVMEEPQRCSFSCSVSELFGGILCGRQARDTMRLGFYIEPIPEDFLS